MSLLLANNLKVPLPDLGGDWLTDGAKNSEVLHLVAHMLVAGALQETQGSGSNIELCDLVLLNDIPVSGKVGVGGCTLENDGGHTQEEWGVDDIGVTGNPADITAAEVPVAIVNVEHILSGGGGTQEITAGGVHDTLGLAGRAGGVEEEERVLRVDGHGGVV